MQFLVLQQRKVMTYSVDLENIKVEKKAGGSIDDTQIVKGIVLDKEIVHSGMPTKIEKQKLHYLIQH